MSDFLEASEAILDKNIGATTGPVTAARAALTAGASDGIATAGEAEGDGGVVPRRAGGRASIDGGASNDMAGGNSSGGKTLSNILCCLCGRSIQPNGE